MTTKLRDDYALCETTAHIVGSSSAAQKALNKFNELKSQGKNPRIVVTENTWRVYGEQ